MLFRNCGLGEDELRVIGAIHEMYKSLRYVLSSPTRWEGALRRSAFARAIQGSNSIEGYWITTEDALAAIEGEEPLEAKDETWRAVLGYRSAMTYVLQLCKDQNFQISEDYLRSLHFMMMQYDLSKHPGNWRPGPIYVRDDLKGVNVYEGPSSRYVPGLISELVYYLNGKEDADHALVKGALAHLNLTMIHPFSDGNGRMARCLQTFAVASRTVSDPTFSSIEEYLGRNTQDYYNVLEVVGQGSWNPRNNTRPWVRFNLTAHYRQAATVLRRNRLLAKLWNELEREIKVLGLPDRVMLALSDAATGLRVRSIHYRHLADISVTVASRDLKEMTKAGLLIAMGEKRGRTYRASDRVRAIAQKIRQQEPGRIPDPFQSDELLTG